MIGPGGAMGGSESLHKLQGTEAWGMDPQSVPNNVQGPLGMLNPVFVPRLGHVLVPVWLRPSPRKPWAGSHFIWPGAIPPHPQKGPPLRAPPLLVTGWLLNDKHIKACRHQKVPQKIENTVTKKHCITDSGT